MSTAREAPPAAAPAPERFAVVAELIRSAVQQVAGGGDDPNDPYRGLYVSDEQALELAGLGAPEAFDDRLEQAAALLGLDAIETLVLHLVAAPEVNPRYGRLFAYLHDDIARRFATPVRGPGAEPPGLVKQPGLRDSICDA